jgi:succinyl-CoA synthetase beta subunit
MMLTEIQGKGLLREARIPTPLGHVARDMPELRALEPVFPVAIKAQVSCGGRGKAGGVRRCSSQLELENAFSEIMRLDFAGTNPDCVLVEPWLEIARELYVAVTIDSKCGGYAALYSPQGGVDVEFGAPPACYPIGMPREFRAHHYRRVLMDVEADPKVRERVISLTRRLLQVAQVHECMTVEINPLIVQKDGSLIAGDAKIVLDEAAAFRNALTETQIVNSRAGDAPDVRACAENGIVLVWLEGNIGLVSGGAGMTMGAMDAIDDAGASAACFLDISGNPTPAGFGLALDLLDSSAQVDGILISMFGGGLHTDRVARTLVDVLNVRKSKKPVAIRLNGTRSEIAGKVLKAAGHRNHLTLEDAVTSIVRHAKLQA